ncbi:hypothetical protein GCM10010249_46850 [Streptomyces roseolilacinus]|uniref:Uncharacterized protein n=1 Tax=Streptomyces roseolilacinus TaxID=66904 RepID=A0A918B5K3_9ACTN|nr:hypothetical protein GCM10010249_46850 [Streptomyces roseolilacinus]
MLLSPSSVRVTVEVPYRGTVVGLADAPGNGAADASGAQVSAPATAAASAAVVARRRRKGMDPRPRAVDGRMIPPSESSRYRRLTRPVPAYRNGISLTVGSPSITW